MASQSSNSSSSVEQTDKSSPPMADQMEKDYQQGTDTDNMTASDVEKDAGAPGSNPDALDWDGPDDPENPMNWSSYKKQMQLVCVALITLVANLAATMFAPGAGELVAEFHVTNSTVAILTVSIYVLGFALGPLILAPLSEIYGRLPVYAGSGVVYVGFTIGATFATGIEMFIVFRFLAGCAGAAPMAIAGGTLADVIPTEDRPKWMGLFVLGPMMGPVLGPIAGGFISQNIGWRWVFRVILIATGALVILCAVFLRETYAPAILRRRAERRRKAQGSGDLSAAVRDKKTVGSLARDVLRPLRLLALSPIVLFLSLYAAFAFGLMFLLFTTFSTVFSSRYGFSVGIAGLSYLGLGCGMFIALGIQAVFAQRIADARAAKNGARKPEDRLPIMAYTAPVLPIGLFWYGWSVQSGTHWIVPILGTVFIGIGVVCIMMPQMIYLVEVYGAEAGASALAANTVLRSTAGAFLPMAGPKMYQRLELGWGNSLLGFLALAFIPVPWILFLYGERIRLSRKVTI